MSSTTTSTTTISTGTFTGPLLGETTTVKFETGVQYGFFFDQSRCISCRACVIACRDWNNIPPGPVKMLKIFEWETGTFANTRLNYLFAPCYHCENPACVPVANGAMFKEGNYGAVLINPAMQNSASLRAAWNACPYGAISFDSDSPTANAFKCTMCIDRLSQNKYPICVEACPMRALDFDTVQNLVKKYGSNQQLEGMPSPTTTTPSAVFNPHIQTKTGLVPYDANEALKLLQQRAAGLPSFFSDPSQVTNPTGVVIGRNQLNMKATSTEDFLYNTQTDD